MKKHNSQSALALATVASLAAVSALAQPTNCSYTGTPDPQVGMLGTGILWPWQVTGKEFVDTPNRDCLNNPVPGQIIAWDGVGGTMNSFRLPINGQVDALANRGDAWFTEVINNQAHLLISVTGDQPPIPPNNNPLVGTSVWYEKATGFGNPPERGTWATRSQIDGGVGVRDLDGLEVWGPDWVDDTDRFSILGDPNGQAVFGYNSGNNTVYPIAGLTDAAIAAAIGYNGTAALDLDALMMNDNGNADWDAGDKMLFSIRPGGGFDGGEVWSWTYGDPSARFLEHGGHVWNTAFSVRDAFGVDNENIDALEAVAAPEPATTAALGALLACGMGVSVRLYRGYQARRETQS